MKRVLHIDFRPSGGSWILRIMTRLGESRSDVLRARFANWGATPLGELAGAIATRLTMIPLIIGRINKRLREVEEDLTARPAEVRACLGPDRCYALRRSELAYELIVDVDSFLFECRSAYEITAAFPHEFVTRILSKDMPRKQVGEWVLKEIQSRGGAVEWVQQLGRMRHFFIHDTAPWPAFEVKSLAPLSGELVLLKKNVTRLVNPEDYLHASQCREIHAGLLAAFDHLEHWLVSEIEAFERQVP